MTGETSVIHPPSLSLPGWRSSPGTVDPAATSVLILCFGEDPESQRIARDWEVVAQAMCPTVRLDHPRLKSPSDIDRIRGALEDQRTGVRVMIVGPQHDVLVAMAQAYAVGLFDSEMTTFATATDDLPMYCAHCRATYRVETVPGGIVQCPGCERFVEVHSHLSKVRGSFLASDSRAREAS